MGMTNSEAFTLFQVINKFGEKEDLPTKFSYALMRNRKRLQPLMETFNDLRKPPEKMTEYEDKRIEMCKESSDKDDNGEAKVEKGNFIISDEAKKILDEKLEAERELTGSTDFDYDKFIKLAFEVQVLENFLFTHNCVENIAEGYATEIMFNHRDVSGLAH